MKTDADFRPFIERVSYLSGEPDRFYFALVGCGCWSGVGVGGGGVELEWWSDILRIVRVLVR